MRNQEEQDHDNGDLEATEDMADEEEEDDQDDPTNDIDMQQDRESTDEESDVEDDEDQELRLSSVRTPQKQAAHTSDRVQKQMTNPEIEAAFHDQYMTQITQAFGDELNTLREVTPLFPWFLKPSVCLTCGILKCWSTIAEPLSIFFLRFCFRLIHSKVHIWSC